MGALNLHGLGRIARSRLLEVIERKGAVPLGDGQIRKSGISKPLAKELISLGCKRHDGLTRVYCHRAAELELSREGSGAEEAVDAIRIGVRDVDASAVGIEARIPIYQGWVREGDPTDVTVSSAKPHAVCCERSGQVHLIVEHIAIRHRIARKCGDASATILDNRAVEAY